MRARLDLSVACRVETCIALGFDEVEHVIEIDLMTRPRRLVSTLVNVLEASEAVMIGFVAVIPPDRGAVPCTQPEAVGLHLEVSGAVWRLDRVHREGELERQAVAEDDRMWWSVEAHLFQPVITSAQRQVVADERFGDDFRTKFVKATRHPSDVVLDSEDPTG